MKQFVQSCRENSRGKKINKLAEEVSKETESDVFK
jgi:hypothetical protein